MSEKDITAAANKTFEQTKEPIRHPEPEEISKAGITTEASLEWERQRPPPVLEPEPTPDDLPGWRTAIRKADEQHEAQIAERRAAFHDRAKDMKERFEMSRDAPSRRHQYDR